MSDEPAEPWVKVADALNEPDAGVIVGRLAAAGIEARYDGRNEPEGLGGLAGQTELGPQEIVVRAADAERAHEALAEG